MMGSGGGEKNPGGDASLGDVDDDREYEAGGFDAIVPAYVKGSGEALRAARNLEPGTRLLRVAPLAAIPYAAELSTICGSCFQRCDDVDSRACERCGVARLCSRCAAGPALEQHNHECHALSRLRDGDSGLTLQHNDLRLLLRLLSVRRQWLTTSSKTMTQDVNVEINTTAAAAVGVVAAETSSSRNPAAEAAAEAGDVIVDDYDAVLELMSGLEVGVIGRVDHTPPSPIGNRAYSPRLCTAHLLSPHSTSP
jgi:SET and MYND domain-containing protein